MGVLRNCLLGEDLRIRLEDCPTAAAGHLRPLVELRSVGEVQVFFGAVGAGLSVALRVKKVCLRQAIEWAGGCIAKRGKGAPL